MKKLALLILVIGVSSMGLAQTARVQIDAFNKAVGATFMKRDTDAFAKVIKAHMTKDFKYVEAGKSMSFETMLSMMKQTFASVTSVTRADSKILKLTEKGDVATASVSHTMVATSVDPKKKTHKMVFMGTSLDTYKKVNGKWLLAVMSWQSQKMLMDGKPFGQPAAPAKASAS